MKNIKYLLGILCLALVFVACEDDYEKQSAGGTVKGTAPVLNDLGESQYPVEKNNDALIFRASWNRARFSYESGVYAESQVNDILYTLELGFLGEEFEEVASVGSTENLYLDVTSGQVYDLLLGLLGENVGTLQNLELRVKTVCTLNGETATLYSNSAFFTANIPPVDPRVVSWKMESGDWAEMAIYCWGDAELFGGWPGQVLTPNEDGWYSVMLPKSGGNFNLIINNNNAGAQMDLVANPAESVAFLVDVVNASITESAEQPFVVRWKDSALAWSDLAVYSWGGTPINEIFGGWPGKVVTPDANGWYQLVFSPGQTSGNLIWNNNGAGAQFDGPGGLTSSACYMINTQDSTWELIDCD